MIPTRSGSELFEKCNLHSLHRVTMLVERVKGKHISAVYVNLVVFCLKFVNPYDISAKKCIQYRSMECGQSVFLSFIVYSQITLEASRFMRSVNTQPTRKVQSVHISNLRNIPYKRISSGQYAIISRTASNTLSGIITFKLLSIISLLHTPKK